MAYLLSSHKAVSKLIIADRSRPVVIQEGDVKRHWRALRNGAVWRDQETIIRAMS